MESKIGNRTNGQAEKSISTILNELKTAGRIENCGNIDGDVAVTGIQFDVNSVTLGVGDNSETLTATFLPENTAGGYYVEVKGKKYPVSKVNEKIEIGKTEITTEGSSTRIIADVGSDDEDIATVEKVGNNGIRINGVAAGTTTITVEHSENITTTISVTVKAKYTVRLYENSAATTATSLTVVEGGKASEATGYEEPAAQSSDEVFDKWVLKTAVGTGTGEKVGDEATSYLNNVTQDLDVYATYTEKPEFGQAELTDYYGLEVSTARQKTGESTATPVSITYGNNQTILGSWQLLYADSTNIYLIYSDYYPNAALQNVGTANTTGATIANGDGNYTLKATDSRKSLIDYLKDTNNWTNISEAFKAKFEVTEETAIKATGSPTVNMYVASWNNNTNTHMTPNPKANNASGYKKLYAPKQTTAYTDGLKGHYIYAEGDTSNTTSYKDTSGLSPTAYPGSGNTGNMYFPYTSVQDNSNCYGFWLARFVN